MNAQSRLKPAYATQAKIERAIKAARKCGLDVAGIEVSPDGVIKVVEARAAPATPENDFDRMEREGLI